ncbi:hypothetical protein F4803DRAFT_555339 [Xylaria telfairii]|nr:hypothetical protein F4803DRAFT_555339 [Xylaria telfairii]
MKRAGQLLAGILGIPLLVDARVAIPPNFIGKPSFLNTTSTAGSPDSTSIAIPCFPFADPDCCIDYAVCECNNGTFFATNKQYGASSLCNPPGPFAYGNGVNSIPGSCC